MTNVKVIVGSGFLWAWFDAVFMSAFYPFDAVGFVAEVSAIVNFATCALVSAVLMVWRGPVWGLLRSNRALCAAGVAGTLGSLVAVVAGYTGLLPLVAVSGILGGFFMAVAQMGWGAAYCRDGARTAVIGISGAFSCAIVLDAFLLAMFDWAQALIFSLFPLLSVAVLLRIDPAERSYAEKDVKPVALSALNARLWITDYLGIPFSVIGGLMLIMFGFGYLQHLVSFSSVAAAGTSHGVLTQVVRGVCAVMMFTVIVLLNRSSGVVWRVGLLTMVAGFMVMPFVFGESHFWVAGALAIGGYTAFDILSWTVSSQEAHAQSDDPVRTIASFRFLTAICYVLGAETGMLLVGFDGLDNPFISQETTVVGYLVVIAVVLLLGSDDIHTLFKGDPRMRPVVRARMDNGDEGAPLACDAPGEDGVVALCDSLGLTSRERDVASLLLQGRTQPWIARSLGISENTVGTHMRHIYQKAGVHDRQQFIDLVTRR